MIAEKILDEGWPSNYWVRDVITKHSLAAMQSYANFFYWLGKEGWVEQGGLWKRDLIAANEEQLYKIYVNNG